MKTVESKRSDPRQLRLVEHEPAALADQAVRLVVESFAVTANNVTYALAGDQFDYWNFFPAPAGAADEWGVVPVWGHARIAASNHPDIRKGERLYGYLPMTEGFDILPGDISTSALVDRAAHRQPMSAVYNRYARLEADPEHDSTREGERMVYGPLFRTGFLLERFFRTRDWLDAEALVLTSASSKTAFGLASVAKHRSPGIERIGLTSSGNAEFCRSSGLYDRVLSYDAIDALSAPPSVLVDFAGNASILRAAHERLGEGLRHSALVGMTHVAAAGEESGAMPGPEPELFFAPTHAIEAVDAMGAAAFGTEVVDSWTRFLDDLDGHVRIERRENLEAASEAFASLFDGSGDPAEAIVIEP